MTVDAVVYYKIYNPMAAVCNVNNAAVSTQLLASTTLRMVLGTKNLSEILSDREHTANVILEQLDNATDPWGIKVKFRIQCNLSFDTLAYQVFKSISLK